MSNNQIMRCHNSSGLATIWIGTKKFQCIGTKPPFDHPHIFLDMGSETMIVCPYCSTSYKYDKTLGHAGSSPTVASCAVDA